jgi:hypothetical protein
MSEEKINKTSEKTKCSLRVEELLVESKAGFMFYVFKPKEVVVDEKYRLGLTLQNQGDTLFNGGKSKVRCLT